jgi:hypothetical protein
VPFPRLEVNINPLMATGIPVNGDGVTPPAAAASVAPSRSDTKGRSRAQHFVSPSDAIYSWISRACRLKVIDTFRMGWTLGKT